MTVGSKVKQTHATLKGIESTLKLYSLQSNDEEVRLVFKDALKTTEAILKDLENVLNSSNNILGIEYIKSLKKLNSNIEIFTMKRLGASYNSSELNNIFSSATSIRKFLKLNKGVNQLEDHVPSSVFDMFLRLKDSNYSFTFDEMMYPYIQYKGFLQGKNLSSIPDVIEGLDNKIIKSLSENNSYKESIEDIKSKRYTYTRISRILCQYFLGFDEYDTGYLRNQPCPYARVLGFNEKGKSALKSIKTNSSIPLYTKIPKELNDTFKLDIASTKAYSILNKSIKYNDDYLISPIITK